MGKSCVGHAVSPREKRNYELNYQIAMMYCLMCAVLHRVCMEETKVVVCVFGRGCRQKASPGNWHQCYSSGCNQVDMGMDMCVVGNM